jgi:hypothetical protein
LDPGLRFRCGSSSYLISEYMRSSATNWNPNEECNPETMDGYKYLVFGGMVKLVKPRYVLTIVNRSNEQQQSRRRTVKKATRSFPITLDQIWGCLGNLLQLSNNMHSGGANNVQGQDLKDLSLAFALSRILRCRLEDVTFPWDIRRGINRDLIRERIIKETDVRRALRIMELQLGLYQRLLQHSLPYCVLVRTVLALPQSPPLCGDYWCRAVALRGHPQAL